MTTLRRSICDCDLHQRGHAGRAACGLALRFWVGSGMINLAQAHLRMGVFEVAIGGEVWANLCELYVKSFFKCCKVGLDKTSIQHLDGRWLSILQFDELCNAEMHLVYFVFKCRIFH